MSPQMTYFWRRWRYGASFRGEKEWEGKEEHAVV